MSTPFIAANWKMNKARGGQSNFSEAEEMIQTFNILKEHGFRVEGETSISITPKGKSIQTRIFFKPREGLLAKVVRVLSFKIELKI